MLVIGAALLSQHITAQRVVTVERIPPYSSRIIRVDITI